MKAQEYLRKNKVSFQTPDQFGDWLVDTTEKEVVMTMNDFFDDKLESIIPNKKAISDAIDEISKKVPHLIKKLPNG